MVLMATVFNIYASIFLNMALSVAQYWVVAMAAGPGTHLSLFWACMATLAVWVAAALLTVPMAVFLLCQPHLQPLLPPPLCISHLTMPHPHP